MSEEKKEEVGVDLEQPKDTRTPEQIEKDNFDADQMDKIRDMVWEFFNEKVLKSDLTVGAVEANLVRYMQGAISITRGKSELWEKANEIQEEYYETPMNKLKLNEDLPETQK
jgi:hypothetical protein